MHLVGRDRLQQAARKHRGSGLGKALDIWVKVVESAKWRDFSELKATFRSADYVDPHVVFNIKGNDFRLIATVYYQAHTIIVERVVTHAQYTREGV